MAQRGRSKYNSNDKGNAKGRGHVRKVERVIQNKQGGGGSTPWQGDDIYAPSTIIEETFSTSSFQAGQTYPADNLPKEEMDWQRVIPVKPPKEQTALAPIDLNPFYEALAEMRERINEAEKSLEHSRQAQQTLLQEMETASQMAQEAEEELAAITKRATYLRNEADQVCSEGQTLQRQLSAEEQHWQQMLEEDQRLLTDTEQKLRIAEEEAQHIRHAKEVAARMNERELWRLGSSKQGLWLQRRKVQGNALPMTRDKSGNWHVPKVLSSPGATYAKNVLEQEQKRSQKLSNDPSRQRKKRLNMLSESAQALAERRSTQVEEEFINQITKQEATHHPVVQAESADKRPSVHMRQETVQTMPEQDVPASAPSPEPRTNAEALQTLRPWKMPEPITPTPTPPPELRTDLEESQALRSPQIPGPNAPASAPPPEQRINEEVPLVLRQQEMPKQDKLTPAHPLAQHINEETPQVLLNQEKPEQSQPTSTPQLTAEPFVNLKDLLRQVTPEQDAHPSSSTLTPAPLAGLKNLLYQEILEQNTPPLDPPSNIASLAGLNDLPYQEMLEELTPEYNPKSNSSLRCFVAEMAPNVTKLDEPEALTPPPPYAPFLKMEASQTLPPQEREEQINPPHTPPVYMPSITVEVERDLPPQRMSQHYVPEYSSSVNDERLQALWSQEMPKQTTPPVYMPSIDMAGETEGFPLTTATERSMSEYAPADHEEPLRIIPRQNTPGQIKPLADDPLQILAMQAAMETAAGKPTVGVREESSLYAKNQEQLKAAAGQPQAEHSQQKLPEINEDDMQHLTRQAHLLAQQHLARQQASSPGNVSANITQRVAEETGGQDHLLKEQQIAEQAIAAAMAAAKKAAQSAMSISGQASQQTARYSAEQLIADALSKASESGV